jgi:hypothetical protein
METRRTFLATATAFGALTSATDQVTLANPTLQRPAGALLTRYRIPNTELTVSRIAYRCAFIDREQLPPNESAIDSVEHLVHTAFDNGITLFHLADAYEIGLGKV